jgi:PKD domain
MAHRTPVRRGRAVALAVAAVAAAMLVVVAGIVALGSSSRENVEQSPPPPAGPAPLEVNATAAPSAGSDPLTVDFSANASGGVPPYLYQWDLGNSWMTGSEASYTYSTRGVYQATATVQDALGHEINKTVSVDVSPRKSIIWSWDENGSGNAFGTFQTFESDPVPTTNASNPDAPMGVMASGNASAGATQVTVLVMNDSEYMSWLYGGDTPVIWCPGADESGGCQFGYGWSYVVNLTAYTGQTIDFVLDWGPSSEAYPVYQGEIYELV